MEIDQLTAPTLVTATDDLSDILHASVQAGGSVGFVLPFEFGDARSFWIDTVFPAVRAERTHLFAMRQSGRIIGTVQLGLAMPANQPHRADVAKLLVHPDARRKGAARALMTHLIAHAETLGKTLLVLDTRSGDPSNS